MKGQIVLKHALKFNFQITLGEPIDPCFDWDMNKSIKDGNWSARKLGKEVAIILRFIIFEECIVFSWIR